MSDFHSQFLSRIGLFKAEDIPEALQALLGQAAGSLRPPTKSEARAPTPAKPATPAATRRMLVGGILLLLDRAVQLSANCEGLRQDAAARLLNAFRQQPWLWELLVRRHLDELLAYEGAAWLVAEAIIRLDAGMQARACSLIRCQLTAAPALATLPGTLQLQSQLLEQLKRCFQVVSLGLPKLEKAATPAVPSATQLQVLLRTQLPALLHVLLALACGAGDSMDDRPAAAAAQQQPSSSAEAGSANASNLHSLHTLASGMAREPLLTARGSVPSLNSAGGSSRGAQAAVLQYAAMLVGQLSSPDALYDMLRLDLLPGQARSEADVAAEAGQRQNKSEGRQRASAVAGRMTSQEAQRVCCALALAEVLLDALLTMPAVAAAVRQQARSSGGGSQEQQQEEETCASSAETGHQCDEVARAAAALLALHWELSKLLAAVGLEPRHLKQGPWSPQTCLRLLQLSAEQPQDEQVLQQQQNFSSRGKHCRVLADLRPAAAEPSAEPLAAEGPLVHLLLPPALLAHTLELVQQALRGIPALPAGPDSWLDVAAERAAALHAACMRGLSHPHAVLASPLHKEAMAAAARLHELLTNCGSDDSGTVSALADMNVAASGQACTNIGGSKRQRDEGSSRGAKRQRQGAASAEAITGNPVAELLQLLLSPQDVTATADAQQQQRQQRQQQQQHTRVCGCKGSVRRLTAEPVQPQQRQQQGAATDLRRRITAQPVTAPLPGARVDDFGAGRPESESECANVASELGSEEGPEEAEAGTAQGRVVMRSAADMTDEQREAMWAAYIADKEAMLEMLGDADYQQWYDEAANPLAQCSRPASGDVDAAFDAAFGVGSGTAGLLRMPPLPHSLLEASSVVPWQAAAAASLKLLAQCLKLAGSLDDGADALAALQSLARRLVSVAQRNAAVQAVLRFMRAGCGRNEWLAADRDAAAAAAGGALLHCMAALHELLTLRTLRRTIPPLLDAHASLIDCLLPAARAEAATLAGAASSRQRQLQPLALAASTARVLLLHPRLSPPPPPQLNIKLNPASLTGTAAAALLRLAGDDQEDIVQAAGMLWALLAQGAARRGEGAPAWVDEQLDLDVSRLVLLGAGAEVRAAAVAELLLQLAQGLATLQARLGKACTQLRLHELLPAMDACSAAMARALAEQQRAELEQAQADDEDGEAAGERQRRQAHPPEQGSSVLMGGVAVKRLAGAAAQLCSLCALGAERLASLLDASGRSSASGGEVPALAELLALGLELGDAVAQVLEGGAVPQQQRQALAAAAERLEGAQQACLELLRGLPEAHPAYAAVTAAMDLAPCLWRAAASAEDAQLGADGGSSSGEDVEEDETEQQQQRQQQRREGSSGRRRRVKDIRNPYLRAILAEGDAGELDAEDLSDLEDFIVVNPVRDYGSFIARHFPQTAEEGEEEEGGGEAGGGSGGDNSDAGGE